MVKSSEKKPHLVSFKLCPFVQRAVITLNEKKIDYSITYIDLENKPDWFLELSPTGKVPVLEVGEHVLFESAVITEYLDEVNPPSLHPIDPLEKARNRSFIEFSSSLLMAYMQQLMAKDQETYNEKKELLFKGLSRFELQIKGPWFNKDFALIDASVAPLFMRLLFMNRLLPGEFFPVERERLAAYAKLLTERESVKKSVVSDFDILFQAYIGKKAGYISQRLSK